MNSMSMDARDFATVLRILSKQLPEYDVYAYGSRVTGKAGKSSDLDLAVMTESPLETMRMADLREAFRESDLPFKVDIADWAGIKENFRSIICQNRVRIQSGKK